MTVRDFPTLNGIGVLMGLLEFPERAVNVPHAHLRGAEILFVVDNALTVRLMDRKGMLRKNVLQKGYVFVFLPHYQQANPNSPSIDVHNLAIYQFRKSLIGRSHVRRDENHS
ncbi:putative germin-like protein 9-2 [Magnolia sinica]|uniref:putative germin-like protein 9-2 n=1 Tax=Magnolia sinica TaxID=86752 RepID=UPI00265A2BF7|nr:putative germin-like protein 9-2 [Magnolia sinica]